MIHHDGTCNSVQGKFTKASNLKDVVSHPKGGRFNVTVVEANGSADVNINVDLLVELGHMQELKITAAHVVIPHSSPALQVRIHDHTGVIAPTAGQVHIGSTKTGTSATGGVPSTIRIDVIITISLSIVCLNQNGCLT